MKFKYGSFLDWMLLLILGSAVTQCVAAPESSASNPGSVLATSRFLATYRTMARNCPSGGINRACTRQALNTTFRQMGYPAPVRKGATNASIVGDLNARRFAVTQACKVPGGIGNDLPATCKSLKGTDHSPSANRGAMIGTLAEEIGDFKAFITELDTLLVMASSVILYDESGKPWSGPIDAPMVARQPLGKNCARLSVEQKSTIDAKYGSGTTFKRYFMSQDYVALHMHDSMKVGNLERRWTRFSDCLIRSIGCGVGVDSAKLYPKVQSGGLPMGNIQFYINDVLGDVDEYFKQNKLEWPRVGKGQEDQTSTMAGGVASRLVDETGVGTYIAAVQNNPFTAGPGGHAVVVSVRGEGKSNYRIDTHDFQTFIQYEGLPQFLTLKPVDYDVRTERHYSFVKVSDTPLALDHHAQGLYVTALKNLSKYTERLPKLESIPSAPRSGW